MASYTRRPCAYCGGKGITTDSRLESVRKTCVACDGFSFVIVPSDFERCRDCLGTGKRHDAGKYVDRLRCKTCGGTGWATPAITQRQPA